MNAQKEVLSTWAHTGLASMIWLAGIKVFFTSAVIVAISEIAKRSSFWAAALASVPLTSLLAFIWFYVETGSSERVATLSQNIFWLVIPSFPKFLLLPLLLRSGINFLLSLSGSCVVTALVYADMIWSLNRMGVHR